jgi:hypothetical protein
LLCLKAAREEREYCTPVSMVIIIAANRKKLLIKTMKALLRNAPNKKEPIVINWTVVFILAKNVT